MGKVLTLPKKFETLDSMIQAALDAHKDSKSGIVQVFEANGDMHTYYYAGHQELALAGARLLKLANED